MQSFTDKPYQISPYLPRNPTETHLPHEPHGRPVRALPAGDAQQNVVVRVQRRVRRRHPQASPAPCAAAAADAAGRELKGVAAVEPQQQPQQQEATPGGCEDTAAASAVGHGMTTDWKGGRNAGGSAATPKDFLRGIVVC